MLFSFSRSCQACALFSLFSLNMQRKQKMIKWSTSLKTVKTVPYILFKNHSFAKEPSQILDSLLVCGFLYGLKGYLKFSMVF